MDAAGQQPAAIVLASANPGKVREMQALLPGLRVIPQSELGVAACAETAATFVENALLKARHAALATGLPALADDSGLQVPALNGAPGVLSARYAGADACDQANIDKLLRAMADLAGPQRAARFVCVIVYLRHPEDPCPLIAEGTWPGLISAQPLGEGGFGYDRVFWLPDHQRTSAQLPAAIKNALSHRGQALRQLAALMARTHR